MSSTQQALTFDLLSKSLRENPLFDQKTWQLSAHPWPLEKNQVQDLEEIGDACYEFYQAIDLLYDKSVQGKKILRNQELFTPWVAEYYDRGKPERLISHARNKTLKNQYPIVLRPDLLLTKDGFIMSELDSVPGGIGLTAFLSELYSSEDQSILGNKEVMLETFYQSLRQTLPDHPAPCIAILVSDEAKTYRPEMEWLASYHQRKGRKVFVFSPEEVFPMEEGLYANLDGEPRQIDIIYRFFELFDLPNISTAEIILEACENEQVIVTPPMKPFHEEKLSLALFHHPALIPYWKETISKKSFRKLQKIIPKSWIIDDDKIPPHTFLHGPTVNEYPIQKWEELANGSQKERELVLKKSGFHEEAWGARSVVLGHDTAKEEFAKALQHSRDEAKHSISILQKFHKPSRLTHPVFNPDGSERMMNGRLRLCPYYFINNKKSQLTGALATFCPADKKIIHGMKDAALLPSCLLEVVPTEKDS